MAGVILEIPLGNLLARGEPYAVELFGVADEIAQGADAKRLADHVRMQADIHEASAGSALGIKPIELLLEHLEASLDGQSLPQEAEVVDLGRVGDGNHRPPAARVDNI